MKRTLRRSLTLLSLILSVLGSKALAQTTVSWFCAATTTAAWTVPAGVTSITFDVQGARGGNNDGGFSSALGGYGARVQGTLAVTPGQVLNIYIGGQGGDADFATATPGAGGFNGGGSGDAFLDFFDFEVFSSGGGGGASDIRIGGTGLANRVIVAGGGGGSGENSATDDIDNGGGGGGTTGQDGFYDATDGYSGYQGFGGTPTAGGAGGDDGGGDVGGSGTSGTGGDAASGTTGGGGGGGYYGGGGGVYEGGGGGSSYTDPILVTGFTHTRGYNSSCGLISLTYSATACDPGIITGTPSACVGGTTPLSETVSTGAWSSDDNTIATVDASGNVTGVSAGTVNILYTVIGGTCTDSAIETVTINALPVIAAISGASSVCVGSTTPLTETTGSGAWSTDDATIATVDALGNVTGIGGGTVNILYTVTNSSGCTDSAIATITVNTLPVVNATTASATEICIGSTATLTNTTVPSGSWSSDDATIASVDGFGVVTGVGAGTVNILYTVINLSGCIDSAITVITVDAQPVVASILGSSSVCVSSTTPLLDATSGGTWSTDDGTIATVDGTGNVTGVAAGTTNIVYTVTTAAGCSDSAVFAVTVNDLPLVAAIGGTTTVCVAGTTSLSDVTGAGTWSSDDATIATVDGSGNVTGVAGGSVNIVYTVTNGSGCTDSAVVSVTVNALPVIAAISGTSELCVAGTTTLTDATGTGFWSSDDPTIASVDASGNVTGNAAGTINILYTVTNGSGCTDSAIFAITIDAAPIIAPIAGMPGICIGSTNAFSDVTTGGVWSSDDATIASVDAFGNVTGVATGTVNILYTVTTGGGCSDSAIISVTVNPLPVIAAITGTTSVCVTGVTTLSDATTGVVWSSDDATIATVDASGDVTGVSAGTVTIIYIGTNSFGCTDSAVTSVTVNALPTIAAITGAGSGVCIGSTIALGETTTGGIWSSDNTLKATVDASGNVTGVASGSVHIVYTVTNISGCTDSAVVNVAVHALPILAGITGTTTVCQLGTTTLSDVTPTGTWSSDDATIASVNATGNVSGVNPGSVNILYTVTSGAGCVDSAIATVTVNPAPAVDVITGNAPVCDLSSIVLADDTTGGVWSSDDGTIASVSPTGTVTGAGAGTVNIVYTVTNSFGCQDSAIASVTVNPLSVIAAIGGTPGVCIGSTTTLTETTTGGTWSSDDATIAGVDATGNVISVSVGTVNILYTVTSALGCTDSAVVAFTVHPLPVIASITGTTSVCQATVTPLADATFGGIWSSDDNSIATVDPFGNVTGVASGNVTILYTVTSPFGCTDSATTVVTVLTAPPSVITVVGDTLLCPGGFVVFNANTGAGLSYQWYDDDGSGSGAVAISGATTSSYIATTTGLYTVEVTNGIGCFTFSSGVNAISSPSTALISALGATTVCAPDSVVLSANVGTGLTYQWLVDGGTISGATNATYGALATGDYAVVVTNAAGCSATSSTITATINLLPSITPINGSATLCVGSMETLTDITDGGTWSSDDATIASIDPSTGAATGVSAGTTNILYTVTTALGCTDSVILSVTVNALPTATVTSGGITTFCVGGTVVLTANAGAGFTYQWLFNGSPISGETNITYTADSTGLYAVVVTSGGCSATSASVQVIAVPTPVLTPENPISFCWGSYVTIATGLGAVPVPGAVYQWQRNGFDITGATSATYTAYLGGNYTCNVTVSGSCLTVSDTIPVTVFPLPNPIISYTGVTLSVANYYVTYQWYKDLVLVAGATSYQLTTADDGHYTVAVTDTNGCQNISDEYIIDLLGVHNVTAAEINIYPNPATSVVHITTPVRLRAVITTVEGKVAMSVEDAKDINVHELPDGVYLIMLYDDNGQQVKVQKLIKSAN